ncbi:hypothetical protein DdX_18023 [Ditylenchus destructor]|uniref:C2H2-type domain-containing protein n=1 Tax=Ditylenchus destructor TaxID=166010 RepID=A0AAD4MQB7_9BILA|nr:hypothetical protein DdX_18023 [Ditylenchus destructor]
MNLECHVCTKNKIATSFHSLDYLRAHLFSIHHDGPSDVFQFVCHKCEFKFGTECSLLRHEETCNPESRSTEDMAKIRYKLQMYELIEKSLKYNMTKNQTSSVPPANPSNAETSETREALQSRTESSGKKRIKTELPVSLKNPISNSRQETSEKNGRGENTRAGPSSIINETTKKFGNLRTVKAETQDKNCSTHSATNTQANVKNLETSEWSILSFEWSSDLIYLSDEEYVTEIKSDPPLIPKRKSAGRKSLLSVNSKSDFANLSSSDSENEKPAAQKANRKSKITKAATKNIETSAQSSIRKNTQIGSFVFSDSSDGSFIEFRKGHPPSKTIAALQNDCAQLENNVSSTENTEEAHSSSKSGENKKLSKQVMSFEKSASVISGKTRRISNV